MTQETTATEAEVVEGINLGTLICRTWDGRGIYLRPEEEVDTGAVLRAQSQAIKGKNVNLELLQQMMAIALCTINGHPITIDMLTKKPKEHRAAIGYRALLKVQAEVNGFSEDIPSGKTSSGLAES